MADQTTGGQVVSEVVRAIRLGVVAVFGIIVPGVWFWSTAVFYIAYVFGMQTFEDLIKHFEVIVSVGGEQIAWIIGFVVVYVTGSVMRILSPDLPDTFSLLRAKVFDRDCMIKWPDRFPYESVPDYLRNRGLHQLAELVPWDRGNDGKKKVQGRRSKTFLHYVKMFIALKNPQLADHLARQEAFIRLLSGVFYAVVCSSILFFVGFCYQRVINQLAKVSLSIFTFNILVVSVILIAFHYQRLREFVMILSACLQLGRPDPWPYDSPRKPKLKKRRGQKP